MATATQSSTPVKFMPRLRDYLAEALELDKTEVRIATEVTGEVPAHMVSGGDHSLQLTLHNPNPVNPNAGAGRYGFPLTRKLICRLRTRGGLDEAGNDEAALADHWAFQDELINALLVKRHTEDKGGEFPFIQPIHYLGAGENVKRIKDLASSYESSLVFQVTYIPEVEATDTDE